MSLLIKIRESKNFTENENVVAKYIFENYRKIHEMTVKNISENTFTSIACVTRMCKKLGLSGYYEFKMKLIEEISLFEKEKVVFKSIDIDKNNDTNKIIEKLNNLSIESLKETKLLQNVELIEKVSKLIKDKGVLDFYGMGASYIVCIDAQYKFMRVGKVTTAFEATDRQYVQVCNSDDNHLAILISYSGMTKEIIKIAEILNKKGIETVSITKYTENTVANLCKYNLYVTSKESLKRSAAIYSRISMLNMIDVLYLKFSNDNYEVVKKKIIENSIEKEK